MAHSHHLPKRELTLMLCGLLAGALLLYYFRPVPQVESVIATLRAETGGRVNSVAFTPDGKTVAIAVEGRRSPRLTTISMATVQLHDVQTGAMPRAIDVDTGFPFISSVSLSPDGKEVICGSSLPTVYDFATGRKKRVFAEAGGGRTGVLPSPDGRFCAGGAGNIVLLWDAHTGRVVRVFGDSESIRTRRTFKVPSVDCAAFSPDSAFIVIGHTDGALRVWNVANSTLRFELAKPGLIGAGGAGVFDVAFSPDGSLVAATDARNIWLFDASNGQLVRSWQTPKKVSVFGICFSPDGKMLAGGGPNFSWRSPRRSAHEPGPRIREDVGEINLWNIDTGRLRHTLRGGHWIINIVFSPDGRTIASSGDDDTALLWRVPE